MARPLRLEHAEALWHVTARGNERMTVFRDEGDYEGFLGLLATVVPRFGWKLHTFVLMPNHFHLVLTTPSPTLSRGMRQLGGVYTQHFNRRWSRCGHLFQGRFFSLHVERETHLLELLRYTALNPVRAGLVADPAAWRWGGYRALAGFEPVPGFLDDGFVRDHFRSRRGSASRAFRSFVLSDRAYDPWSQVTSQVFLGSEGFRAARSAEAREVRRTEGIPSRQIEARPIDARTAWKRLWEGSEGADATPGERDLSCVLLRDDLLATYREIGDCIGLTTWGARSAVDRGRRLLSKEPSASRSLERLRRALHEHKTQN